MDVVLDPVVDFGLKEAIKAIGYILKYGELIESLEKDLKSLDARLSTVKKEVDYYKDEQQRVIRDDVTEWIQQAGKVSDNAQKFLKTVDKDGTGCCGHCNCWRRYKDGRVAEDLSENIVELTKRGEWRVSGAVYLSGFVPVPMAKFWAEGYVAVPSMDEKIKDLKQFLQEKFVVGIYGVKGVGKTTLAKKLAADMELVGVNVVLADGNDDEEKIQIEIAERVGHELTSKTSTERVVRLFNKLSRTKVLIIFDNVHQRIDLNAIGIPRPAPNNNCRILVVSETLQACQDMHSQENLQIYPLVEEESRIFAAGLAKNYNWPGYSVPDQMLSYELSARIPKFKPSEGNLPLAIKIAIQPIFVSMLQTASTSTGAGTSRIQSSGGNNSESTPAAISIFLNADKLEIDHVKKPQYWSWGGTKSSPEAVLIRVWYLHIEGEATGLESSTNYGAYFWYKLSDYANGFTINPVEMVVGRKIKCCYLNEKLPEVQGWQVREMGRFNSDDYEDSEVKLIVQDHDTSIVKTGLRIRRIELRKVDWS